MRFFSRIAFGATRGRIDLRGKVGPRAPGPLHRSGFIRAAVVGAALAACCPAFAADRLTVMLDWFVNPNHGPLIVAREIGAYKRAGLDVVFVQPADPTIPPRLVAAGHGDIAIDYQPQLYQQVSNGLPLMRIGVLVDKSLETLVTLRGDGLTMIADLKGKRIGYNEVGGSVGQAELACMLATGNLTMKDVTMVNVGTALSTSLLTHRVDAVGVDRNFEAFELIDKGAKPIGFDYEKFGVPQFDDLIMVVNKNTTHDPRYPRFLAAVKEGAAYIKARPEAGWKLFIRAYPNLDNKLDHDAWNFTVPYFAADPAALDTVKYVRFGEFLASRKVIKTAPPLASYAVELK
jgi:putative hydroxymethylpyrimidine transport system substrate-binding protein